MVYHIFKSPIDAKVSISLDTTNHYIAEFVRSKRKDDFESQVSRPSKISPETISEGLLTLEDIFKPIFDKVPKSLLLETVWKVITESFITNYSTKEDETIKTALKEPSALNLTYFILKIIEFEEEDPDNLASFAELVGEFTAKIIETKLEKPIYSKLQPTLQDKKAENYLVYYECNKFCAKQKYPARCKFIHSIWLGILGEAYKKTMEIKEVFHAGKKDRYCMIEIGPIEK